MALLYYANIGVTQPEFTLSKTYNGLQDFFHYLKRAKQHYEQTRPTLPWRRAGALFLIAPAGNQRALSEARWRQLEEFLQKHRDSEDDLRITQESGAERRGSATLEVWDFDPRSRMLVAEGPVRGQGSTWLGTRKEPRQLEVALSLAAEDAPGLQGRCWIELVELAGKETEKSVFDAFLDEELKDIYELEPLEKEEEEENEDNQVVPAADKEEDAEAEIDGRRKRRRRTEYLEGNKISVLDRRPDDQVLCLPRLPKYPLICVRPNTYVVDRQMDAVKALMNQPDRAHRPLINLFQRVDVPRWPAVQPQPVSEWYALTRPEYPGTAEQREFVRRALGTEDFMLLEGPPGSGKTTAIIELVLQLIAAGKRVLLTASTHVAVDNVIKDLKDPNKPWCDKVLLCRIGEEKKVRSERVRPYCLGRLADTERQRLIEKLEQLPRRSESQEALRIALHSKKGHELMRTLLLDTVQVVAGTTLGILQHPAIRGVPGRRASAQPHFDVMILDEASKTPFAEFLVPALLARRWIIVGDRRQLSPYIEEDWVQTNIEAAIPEEALVRAGLDKKSVERICLDIADCVNDPQRRALIVADLEPARRAAYLRQATARLQPESTLDLDDAARTDEMELALARVVVGSPQAVTAVQAQLPLDPRMLRIPPGSAPLLRRRYAALQEQHGDDPERTWAGEIAWRLIREYELRMLPELLGEDQAEQGETADKRLSRQREGLLPVKDLLLNDARAIESTLDAVDAVRRVALPSILESLQHGFGMGLRQKVETALALGLPAPDLAQRLVRLTHQHRMHPDISAFPRHHIYRDQALRDPEDMAERRAWEYEKGSRRARFLHVDAEEQDDPIRNEGEVPVVIEQLTRFAEWARNHRAPHDDGVWSVAVLSFYLGQERLLRKALQEYTAQRHKTEFSLAERGREFLRIQLGTVDGFQGHEADVVLLSMVRTRKEGFLNSPNRLNVALTRARRLLLVIGNRSFFLGAHRKRSRGGPERKRGRVSILLRRLAEALPYDIALGNKEQR